MTDCELAKISVTRNGVVTHWNKAAESLFGYTAAEMIGRPVRLLGACTRRQKVDAIRRVFDGKAAQNIQTVRIRKDGRSIPVLLTVSPIEGANGEVVGMDASVIEIRPKQT